MMKQFLYLALGLVLALSVNAQRNYNLQLLSNVPFPGENGNDCWGYVDSIGIEYAIMGTTAATYIYSLENATSPVLRARIPGAQSVWRDIKSYGKFLYVTTDQGADGLLIIDMSKAPATITHSFYKPVITIGGVSGTLERAHNLYISKEGFAVLAGANVYAGAPIFFDVKANPTQPPFVGATRPVYAHDVFAERNRLYSSDIYTGELTIHDYSNVGAITALGSASTTSNFTHNAWPTNNDQFAFTTDERSQAFVDAFDVSDPTAIKLIDKFRPDDTFLSGSIPHNTHVNGDYLATSWYRDGVIITDALRPHNLVQVGQYDTYPNGGGDGFDGCWGTYPFLPSGRLIASDINTGLYIFDVNYQRGCYFEGIVIDSITRQRIGNVFLNFDDRPAQSTLTDLDGTFATGIYEEGTYPVLLSKLGYRPKMVTANMSRGNLDYRIIELVQIPPTNLDVKAIEEDGTPIPNPVVDIRFLGERNGRNRFDIYVGRWGYRTQFIADTTLPQGASVTITRRLARGYADDFVLDLGWQTSGTAITGLWERGVPIGTETGGVPVQLGFDVDNDLGDQAYVTGNKGGSAGDFDIDGGTAILTSPIFDLTSADDAKIRFAYHFFNGGGSSTPNDTLDVFLTNGFDTIRLLHNHTTTSTWTRYASGQIGQQLTGKQVEVQRLVDKLPLTANMQLIVVASDFPTSGHLVEAMFDDFSVLEIKRPSLVLSNVSGCAPYTTTLSIPSVSGSLTWSLPGGNPGSGSGSTITSTYTQAGEFDVSVQILSNGEVTNYIYRNAIKVESPAISNFEATINGLAVQFDNLSASAVAFTWDFGDGTLSTLEDPEHIYSVGGTYEVRLIASSPCGADTSLKSVMVRPLSTIDFAETTGLEVIQNPSSDVLRLNYTGAIAIELLLVSSSGQIALSQKLPGAGTYSLAIDHLAAGIYLLTVPKADAGGIPVSVLH